MKVDVVSYSYCVYHHEEDPDDRWGYVEEDYDSGVTGIEESDKGEYELPDGSEEAWVVWERYSDGSTFGRRSGLLAIHAVFTDREDARALTELLSKADTDNKYSVEYKGQHYYLMGSGYFERCEDLDYDCFKIK